MRHVKHLLAVSALVGGFVLGTAGTAFAADSYGTPGTTVALSHTICADHGSFGAFGKTTNFAGGATGHMTGSNNARVCGRPQGTP